MRGLFGKDDGSKGSKFFKKISSKNEPVPKVTRRIGSVCTEQKDPETQYRIGRMYQDGIFMPRDDIEAVKWYKAAAEGGNASAQYQLGMMCWQSPREYHSYRDATRWCLIAAEQGLDDAQSTFEGLYQTGMGVLHNDLKKADWHKPNMTERYYLKERQLDGLTDHIGTRRDSSTMTPGKEKTTADVLEVVIDAIRGKNYAKSKFVLDSSLNPLRSKPSPEQATLWHCYALSCTGLGFFDEAERSCMFLEKLGYCRDEINELLCDIQKKRSAYSVPDVICKQEKIGAIVRSILPCFPWVDKDVSVLIPKNQSELDENIREMKHSNRTKIDDQMACVLNYGGDRKNVIVLCEDFPKLHRIESVHGVLAHEIAHLALFNGMGAQDVCRYFDAEHRKKLYLEMFDENYHGLIGSNEFVTDAAVISRGFTYDLSMNRAKRGRPYMKLNEVSTWWNV
jgi:FOG: TPR repeat, SEL1 subfamily